MTNLDKGTTLVTDAKQRLVVNTRAGGGPGSNTPQRIICAEPSPDVAQALSTAISASLEASNRSNSSNQSGSAALGVATAASVAQLGERLGTIQLLRDGFYRACEAYSNGAITETSYALMVGRIDEVMATMLSTEIAGKAFGRNLASISGSASANAGQLTEALEQIGDLTKDKLAALNELDQAKENLDKEKGNATKDEPNKSNIEREERNVRLAQSNVDNIKEAVEELAKATASASASGRAASAIGQIAKFDGTDDAAVSESVAKIHRQFIENDNIDSLMTACITALDRSPSYRHSSIRPTGGDIEYLDGGPVNHHPPRPPLNSRLSDTCAQLFRTGRNSPLMKLRKGKQMHAERMAQINNKRAAYALATKYLDSCVLNATKDPNCGELKGLLQSTGVMVPTMPTKSKGGQVTIPNSNFTIKGSGTASLPLPPGTSIMDIIIEK